MILRKFTQPPGRLHTFTDIDPLSPSPSLSPAPSTPILATSNSKTHAFFSSALSSKAKAPVTSSKDSGKGDVPKTSQSTHKSQTPRSLTVDFFAASPKPMPPPTSPVREHGPLRQDPIRNGASGISNSPPTSTSNVLPTPIHADSQSPSDSSSQLTPRPPSLTPKTPYPQPLPAFLFNFESLASPVPRVSPSPINSRPQQDPLLGAKEDAEILPPSRPNSDSGHDFNEEFQQLAPGMIIHSLLPGHDSSPSPSLSSSSISGSTAPDILSPSSSGSSSTLLPPSDSSSSNASSHEPSGDVSLLLTRRLGSGAFSNVWLAEDLSPTSLLLKTKKSLRDLKRKSIRREGRQASGKLKEPKRSSSLMETLSGGVSGTKPYSNASPVKESQGHGFPLSVYTERNHLTANGHFEDRDGEADLGPSVSRHSSLSWKSDSSESHGVSRSNSSRSRSGKAKLVAVKFTLRGSIEHDPHSRRGVEDQRERDRLRVSFVREVEVLKHISHPNITPLLSHLTTTTHHLLILPYCPGGDLLGLIGSALWHRLTESIVRRIWVELCRAVAWIHSVGLVHRDIKLENILLTESLLNPLPISPAPLIQLTDFGLSRFIDPAMPLLETRCGSEAYAAPELIVLSGRHALAGGPSRWGPYEQESSAEGGYDARETDAWSCGVALYELVTRELPFGDGPGGRNGASVRCSGAKERRKWLIKIARAEWSWPDVEAPKRGVELSGRQLVNSAGIRRMVARLLVKDPSKRARVDELWNDEWMQLDIEPSKAPDEQEAQDGVKVNVWRASQAFDDDLLDEDEVVENEIYEDGWIVDGEGISNIARQEVL